MAYKTLSVDAKLIQVIDALKVMGRYDSTQAVLDAALGLLMMTVNSEKVGDKVILRAVNGAEFILPKDMEEALHQLNHKLYDKFGGKMPDHECSHAHS